MASQEQAPRRAAACAFCKRALHREFYFSCRWCGATYCYIHMSRHGQAHKMEAPPIVLQGRRR